MVDIKNIQEKAAKENGVKKTKTPRNYDSILKGALALALHERIELKKAIINSIDGEVKHLFEAAREAEKISQE